VWAVEDPKSKAAMGVGAFNLFRKSALEKSPGLEWLKMEIADDAALGIMLKRAGARQRVVIGQEAVSLEFYESYSAMARALEKNGAMAPVGLILVGLLAISALELGYLAAFFDQRLQIVGLISWLIAFTTQLGVCRWLRMPSWPAIFPGLGIIPLVTAIGRSGMLAWKRGGVNWRGTFYATAIVRAGMRIK
jgi:cellulose synthase/poly-beta-1,6-N-acetylglucosamine synthase-like glycosyltransferase